MTIKYKKLGTKTKKTSLCGRRQEKRLREGLDPSIQMLQDVFFEQPLKSQVKDIYLTFHPNLYFPVSNLKFSLTF
jgi:hypothetical protein